MTETRPTTPATTSRAAGPSDRPRPLAIDVPAVDFDRLVAAESASVARLVQRLLGWRADVEDVVQDVFVAVWRNWDRFRGQASRRTWLTRIAINACRSAARRQTLKLRWLMLLKQQPPRGRDGPRSEPDGEAELERVRQAVRALPIRFREAVVLRYLEELAVEDIAGVLGVKKNAVEVRLSRARQMLKSRLGDLRDTL